ncbi:acyl-[acyl-carrier-protein] thioesterase [Prevotella sp. OH937_COT-195]|uniref:acyl-[acyl-carrier-protein] thioesterase n=1 Tax=Prevotella sp. OH937_COT-195 TaxID=2491051 RepID=UPI000F65075B|nr:acyl-ACP thioesterase domain-containing protein [Prevotella sp. OH937_COT-195]RRC97685.1 acyl-[acyl-carrier-protein] thioesterase [Prevotella sp. OH937_COT-195]
MEITEKVGIYENMAEPFHCDFSHRLFMGHLGNHLLNAADFHSRDRGFGMDRLNPMNKTWVLSRLAIEMDEMPVQYEKFCVETWIESAMRYFTNRSFRITSAPNSLNMSSPTAVKSKIYGHGRSVWAMIDTVTRQPCSIFDVNDGAVIHYVESEKENPMDKLSRVKIGDGAKLVSSIDTHYGDVDVNGHINSVKYIEHVLDLFPVEWYMKNRLRRFDIAYVAESHYGDKLNFYSETDVSDARSFKIRITKTPSCGGAEVEVCRCKLQFVDAGK